eukprot:3256294-Pyramimonas_sp.AAC.1
MNSLLRQCLEKTRGVPAGRKLSRPMLAIHSGSCHFQAFVDRSSRTTEASSTKRLSEAGAEPGEEGGDAGVSGLSRLFRARGRGLPRSGVRAGQQKVRRRLR